MDERPTRRDFVAGAAGALGLFTGDWSAAANSPSPTGSQIGTIYPFVLSQAVHGEVPLSYLNPQTKDLRAWKRRARARLLELLHYSPPKCDPQPTVLDTVDLGSYRRELLAFNTTPQIRVPAYLYIPKKVPAPGIVALHDHGGFYLWGKEKLVDLPDEHPVLTQFKKDYYGGRSIATELAKQGYVVLVIDMFYWGERRMLLDEDPADWRERPRSITPERIAEFNRRAGQNECLVGRTIEAAGFTWPGVMFWDDVRSVDYLVSRPEVDKDRIGCVGLSVGGFRSCHLASLDDRIKASVMVGWMCSFPAQLQSKIIYTIGHTMLVQGLYRELDYADVASIAMPGARLVINGSRDGLFDLDGVKHSFDKLNRCYAKAGIPERVKTSLYDTPHEFNRGMQDEAWEWLARWLRN